MTAVTASAAAVTAMMLGVVLGGVVTAAVMLGSVTAPTATSNCV